jgi:SAM-dependent methyltransferase
MALSRSALNSLCLNHLTLSPLLAFLRSSQYSLAQISRLVGEKDPSNFIKNAAQCAFMYGNDLEHSTSSPLACLVLLFLLGRRVSTSVYEVLPPQIRDLLQDRELVKVCETGGVTGDVTIGEYRSSYFLSDRLFESDESGIEVHATNDAVWPMSEWSLNLYERFEEDLRRKTLLDVGCGSGCLSILAHRNYRNTIGIDLNSRAVAFSRLNAALAGAPTEMLQYQAADCFGFPSDPARKFDHVVFAAPGGPSGDVGGTAMVSHGGRLGHELLLRFLAERVEDLLTPIGVCQVWGVFAVEARYGTIHAILEHSLPPGRFVVSIDVIRSGGLYVSPEHIRTRKLPFGCHYVPGYQGAEFLESLREREIVEVASAVVTLRFGA